MQRALSVDYQISLVVHIPIALVDSARQFEIKIKVCLAYKTSVDAKIASRKESPLVLSLRCAVE